MAEPSILNQKSFYPLYWIFIAVILLVADYFSGPFIQFPITYLIPVALASWYSGKWWGLAFAVLMPLVRFSYNIALWTIPWTIVEASVNATIRISVLALFSLLIDRTAEQSRRLAREIHLLEGILPICSFCKKVRDEHDVWHPIEKYIASKSGTLLSHGVCPECAQKYYGDILKKKSGL